MTHQEIEALAREISASEGVSLAQAREIAQQEIGAVVAYAQDWDRMVGQRSPAQPIYRVSAA
jgi:hypothetical protein